MRNELVLILLLTCVLHGATSIDISGKVILKNHPERGSTITVGSVRVSIHGSDTAMTTTTTTERVAQVKPDGSFTIRGVGVGAYVVEVHSGEFVTEPERLEVREGGGGGGNKVKCRGWEERRSMLMISLTERAMYFAERPRFNPMTLVKNPMVIMMGFSVLMMIVMPKLTANMAPEDRAQLLGDNKISLADGRVIDRDDLIPRWIPQTVSFPIRPPFK